MIENILWALTGALGGCVLTLAGGWILEQMKADRDDVVALCREFSDLVAEVADAGAAFRMHAGTDGHNELELVRLQGWQMRVAAYCTILNGRIDEGHYDDIQSCLARFFDALTGGDADSPDRAPSRTMASAVYDQAKSVTIAVRIATFHRVNLRESFGRWLDRQWMNGPVLIRGPKP